MIMVMKGTVLILRFYFPRAYSAFWKSKFWWPIRMRELSCFTINILFFFLVTGWQILSLQTGTLTWSDGLKCWLFINLFHPIALGLDREIGNFEVGKEFDALLINPKASDSPIDLFYGDFVGDISEVSKRKLIKRHLFHEVVKIASL